MNTINNIKKRIARNTELARNIKYFRDPEVKEKYRQQLISSIKLVKEAIGNDSVNFEKQG